MTRRAEILASLGTFTFAVCVSFSAVLAWVGGYNFDTRSTDVAVGLAFTLLISGGLTVVSVCATGAAMDLAKQEQS